LKIFPASSAVSAVRFFLKMASDFMKLHTRGLRVKGLRIKDKGERIKGEKIEGEKLRS
jgi:hypothetical protein